MARPIIEPTETNISGTGYRDGDIEYNHPAFGQISVSRVSGLQILYGSDFEHSSYVVIRIKPSRLNRHLHTDWFHAENHDIVEVALSHAQWATFVSSFNIGEGTPCTIQSREGEQVPGLPLRDKLDKAKPELDENITKSIAHLKKLRDQILSATKGMSKTAQAEAVGHIDMSIQELQCNMPFTVERFMEDIETRVEKAKVEVHSHMQMVLHRTGIQALGGDPNTTFLAGPEVDKPLPKLVIKKAPKDADPG